MTRHNRTAAMKRTIAGIAAAVWVVGAAAAPAHAAPKILLCYADANVQLAQTIATNLNQNNVFASVDLLDCSKSTPTLDQLKMYDGVFLWDDLQYASAATR